MKNTMKSVSLVIKGEQEKAKRIREYKSMFPEKKNLGEKSVYLAVRETAKISIKKFFGVRFIEIKL